MQRALSDTSRDCSPFPDPPAGPGVTDESPSRFALRACVSPRLPVSGPRKGVCAKPAPPRPVPQGARIRVRRRGLPRVT